MRHTLFGRITSRPHGACGGFTLLEVMVALILGTIIVGGVMGLISVTLQYTQRVRDAGAVQPILEAAAQEIIAHPELTAEKAITLKAFPDAPPVEISLMEVVDQDGLAIQGRSGQLFRIMLNCRGHLLEFSLIIPEQAMKK